MLRPDSKCPFMRLCCFLMLTLPSLVAGLQSPVRAAAASGRRSAAVPAALLAPSTARGAVAARAALLRRAPRPCWAPPPRASLDAILMGVGGGGRGWGGDGYPVAADYREPARAEELLSSAGITAAVAEVAAVAVLAEAAAEADLTAAAIPASIPSIEGRVIVLGAGWVGSRLAASLSAAGSEVAVTNRPDWADRRKEPYFAPIELSDPPVRRLEFDIADRQTWASLPKPETLGAAVLTFPTSLELARAFWEAYLCRVPRVIAYSSTAVYRIDVAGQNVDEATPVRATPRSELDSYLQKQGATVLTISGIFGEPRGPRGVCTCLAAYASSGGALNGLKSVNMVHVDDIIAATSGALAAPVAEVAGERINVGGSHFRLHELMCHCKYPQEADADSSGADTDMSSKVVSSDKLLRGCLPPGFEFVPPLESADQTEARLAAAASRAGAGAAPRERPAAAAIKAGAAKTGAARIATRVAGG